MGSIGGILVALLLIGLMATLHELGHFLTGKKLGFKILAFQIFMGPKLFEWERDGIQYRICLLPLGASVQFDGEFQQAQDTSGRSGEDAAEPMVNDDPGAFVNRPKRARAAVILAGPLTNLITGVLAMLICFALVGYHLPEVSAVQDQSQAAAAGLMAGDRILSVDGRRVGTDLDILSALMFKTPSASTELTVRRGGQTLDLHLVPEVTQRPMFGITIEPEADGRARIVSVQPDSNGGHPVLAPGDIIQSVGDVPVLASELSAVLSRQGESPVLVTVERGGQDLTLETRPAMTAAVNPVGFGFRESHDMLRAIPYSVQYSWSYVSTTFRALGRVITGQLSPAETLSGPVGIVNVISDVVTADTSTVRDKLVDLLRLFSLISLSLGLTNLLPIPLLDGNQLLLLLVEAIRGRRLSYKAQSVISIVGVAMLAALFIFALYADVLRLIR